MTEILILIGAFGTVIKGLLEGLDDLELKRMTRDHLDYSIFEIGQNIENETGRLAVTQTPENTIR